VIGSLVFIVVIVIVLVIFLKTTLLVILTLGASGYWFFGDGQFINLDSFVYR
jgi:hypothetical protein